MTTASLAKKIELPVPRTPLITETLFAIFAENLLQPRKARKSKLWLKIALQGGDPEPPGFLTFIH